jgi:hypothetical protein
MSFFFLPCFVIFASNYASVSFYYITNSLFNTFPSFYRWLRLPDADKNRISKRFVFKKNQKIPRRKGYINSVFDNIHVQALVQSKNMLARQWQPPKSIFLTLAPVIRGLPLALFSETHTKPMAEQSKSLLSENIKFETNYIIEDN